MIFLVRRTNDDGRAKVEAFEGAKWCASYNGMDPDWGLVMTREVEAPSGWAAVIKFLTWQAERLPDSFLTSRELGSFMRARPACVTGT